MMKRFLTLTMLSALSPIPALAGVAQCYFETECYGQNACEDTEWEATLATDAGDLVMISQGSQTRLSPLPAGGDVRHFAGAEDSGSAFLLSIARDDSVVYTMRTFYEGIINTTWYGTCDGASRLK